MNSRLSLLLFLFLVIVPLSRSSIFKTFSSITSPKSPLSSIVLPLSGNVFPLGYYSVLLKIGNPPKAFQFDIDTGSDVTWVQCNAPCSGCTVGPPFQYTPKANTVPCSDPICSALHWPNKPQCPNPKEQCDYEVEYADQGSSMGALVTDQFPLTTLNGAIVQPRLAFGCGYDQSFPSAHPPPATAGVLGLGKGKISILSQLVSAGVTRNVVGHCLSSKGGGYLFFGDNLIPSTGVAWTPLLSPDNHYTTGAAEILFNGKPTGLKGLKLIFDTGSSYTYFNSKTYQTIVKLIETDLKATPLKDAKEDKTLPICWKGAKPFKSVLDVKTYFKTLTINFTNGRKNTQLQIPPESYLIISNTGNVCLGLLNGSEVGLQDSNVIGDISMQGLMVIYDNEKQQLGWVTADCNKLPRS
ncbi:PREDICTED: aspartic proteinase Asp1 [Camelina sativa]|uniref:Aspartic proteinase Asp1 n=1 Tax=Camelina sativa TaxID=90675 RepID=A0ABM0X113_CAMSA|nr:PREDICTED: aspartic proteinase Asp1 [Camelina sativa]